jgi:hypothetical protein
MRPARPLQARPLRRIAAACTVALALAVPATGASAQSLLRTPGPDTVASAIAGFDADRQVVRQRLVEIDRSVLTNHLAPAGITGAAAAAAARSADGLVQLDLFPGISGLFQRSSVESDDDSALAWNGRLVGNDYGTANLRLLSNGVFGQVQIGARTFRIEPLGNDLHVVKQMDTESLPGDIVVPVPRQSAAAPAPADVQPQAGATYIDLVVAFTVKARNASSAGIANEIRLAVQLANLVV